MNDLSRIHTPEIIVRLKKPMVLVHVSSPKLRETYEPSEYLARVIQPGKTEKTDKTRPLWILLDENQYGRPIWIWQEAFDDDLIDVIVDGGEIDDFEELLEKV